MSRHENFAARKMGLKILSRHICDSKNKTGRHRDELLLAVMENDARKTHLWNRSSKISWEKFDNGIEPESLENFSRNYC